MIYIDITKHVANTLFYLCNICSNFVYFIGQINTLDIINLCIQNIFKFIYCISQINTLDITTAISIVKY